MKFPNLAGKPDIDDICAFELEQAGITVLRIECLRNDHPEVHTAVRGELPYWGFHRNWYYWVARGAAIPPDYAERLHARHGKVCRVNGHCGCPSPFEDAKGFGIGLYHVDTQEGLCALADTIRSVMRDAADKH